MPKHKAAKNADIRPWLSARCDCKEGRFIQLGNSLLLSKEYQALSSGARHMYACMTMESGGKKTYEFSKNRTGAKYGIPGTSFDRHVKELKEKRFILCIEDNHTIRQPNLYEFCLDWKTATGKSGQSEGLSKKQSHLNLESSP